ncbi:MAG: hypothetical protein HDR03_14560 [Lachnospiraceae bacterium]|nr:hypothetical protein [Lachnospiraceae bacterium]
MKKIISVCICVLFVAISLCGCNNEKTNPYFNAVVLDDEGTSFTVECTESSLDTIENGTRVYFEKNAMVNTEDMSDFDIGDNIRILYNSDRIKDGDPIELEVVFAVYLLDQEGNLVND